MSDYLTICDEHVAAIAPEIVLDGWGSIFGPHLVDARAAEEYTRIYTRRAQRGILRPSACTCTPLYMCAKLRQSADRDVLKFQQMFSPEIGTKLSRCFRAGAWMRGEHVENGEHLPGRRRQPRKTTPSAPPAPVLAAFRYNLSRRGQEASTRLARGRSGQIA